MAYDLLFNAMMMDPDDDEHVVRYLQVGMVDGDGFTGLITDYCGGGEWDDCYVMHDAVLEAEELDVEDPDEATADDFEAHIEAEHPGLMEAIWERRESLVELQEGDSVYPVAVDELLDLAEGAPAGKLLSDAPGALVPIEAFHTTFDSGDEDEDAIIGDQEFESLDAQDDDDDDDDPPYGFEDEDE